MELHSNNTTDWSLLPLDMWGVIVECICVSNDLGCILSASRTCTKIQNIILDTLRRKGLTLAHSVLLLKSCTDGCLLVLKSIVSRISLCDTWFQNVLLSNLPLLIGIERNDVPLCRFLLSLMPPTTTTTTSPSQEDSPPERNDPSGSILDQLMKQLDYTKGSSDFVLDQVQGLLPPNFQQYTMKRPLDYAAGLQRESISKMIFQSPAVDPRTLIHCLRIYARKGNLNMVQWLLDKQKNPVFYHYLSGDYGALWAKKGLHPLKEVFPSSRAVDVALELCKHPKIPICQSGVSLPDLQAWITVYGSADGRDICSHIHLCGTIAPNGVWTKVFLMGKQASPIVARLMRECFSYFQRRDLVNLLDWGNAYVDGDQTSFTKDLNWLLGHHPHPTSLKLEHEDWKSLLYRVAKFRCFDPSSFTFTLLQSLFLGKPTTDPEQSISGTEDLWSVVSWEAVMHSVRNSKEFLEIWSSFCQESFPEPSAACHGADEALECWQKKICMMARFLSNPRSCIPNRVVLIGFFLVEPQEAAISSESDTRSEYHRKEEAFFGRLQEEFMKALVKSGDVKALTVLKDSGFLFFKYAHCRTGWLDLISPSQKVVAKSDREEFVRLLMQMICGDTRVSLFMATEILRELFSRAKIKPDSIYMTILTWLPSMKPPPPFVHQGKFKVPLQWCLFHPQNDGKNSSDKDHPRNNKIILTRWYQRIWPLMLHPPSTDTAFDWKDFFNLGLSYGIQLKQWDRGEGKGEAFKEKSASGGSIDPLLTVAIEFFDVNSILCNNFLFTHCCTQGYAERVSVILTKPARWDAPLLDQPLLETVVKNGHLGVLKELNRYPSASQLLQICANRLLMESCKCNQTAVAMWLVDQVGADPYCVQGKDHGNMSAFDLVLTVTENSTLVQFFVQGMEQPQPQYTVFPQSLGADMEEGEDDMIFFGESP